MIACVLWILSGLLCLGCAEKEDRIIQQREIDLSIPTEQREEKEDRIILQREVIPFLPFEHIEDPHIKLEKEIDFYIPADEREDYRVSLARGEQLLLPMFYSHSRSSSDLDTFPPGKPSRDNIGHICRETRTIVTYGADDFTQMWSSDLRRQGNAINRMEEGYSRCCNQSEKFHCALKVWKNAMDSFCKEGSSIKTPLYHCCRKRISVRETCFSNEAPNPNYTSSAPLLEIDGTDTPSMPTPRSLKPCSPHSPVCQNNPKGKFRLSDLAFPPGEPKSSNIQNICKLRKYRPLYTDNIMPQSGFGHYVRRAKAIYRAESEFKKCCKTEDVACAHSGWQKALSKFCDKELEVKSKHYECCKKEDQSSVLRCFASEAPFPEYDKEVETLNLSNITESILEKVCTDCKLLTKQEQLPLLLLYLKDSCCSLPQDEKLLCAQKQKEKFMKTLCGSKKDSWKDTQNCCSKDDLEREECFSFYLQNISMAVSHRANTE